MNIRRIVTPSDPLYADCVRIYENSFPYAERRDTAGMTEYLKDDRLHFLAFYGDREEDGPYGFFTFWDFGHGYLYGEHFAVDPSRRGGGTGTAVLDYIKGLGRPMLLEIELPVEDDEMTFRRKLFYERNGFILNPWAMCSRRTMMTLFRWKCTLCPGLMSSLKRSTRRSVRIRQVSCRDSWQH